MSEDIPIKSDDILIKSDDFTIKSDDFSINSEVVLRRSGEVERCPMKSDAFGHLDCEIRRLTIKFDAFR